MKEFKENAEKLLRRLSTLTFDNRGRNHFVTKEESKVLKLLLCNLKYLTQINEIDLERDYSYNTKIEFGNECPKIPETIEFKEVKNVNNPT